MVLLPLPLLETKGFFSPYIHRGPGRAPRGKTHQLAGPPDDWVPLELVTCVAAHAERRAVCQLPFRFSCPDPGSAYRFCSGRLGLSVPTWLSRLGAALCPVTSLLRLNLRKVVDFAACSAFVVGMDWRLPSPLQAELKTGSPKLLLLFF